MSLLDAENMLQFKIGMFIDNELNFEEKLDLEKNLATDPQCQDMLIAEKQFRDYLKNHIQRPSLHPEKIQKIRSIFE